MFVGAGAAAIGIATLLQRELVAEGMDPAEAAAAIVMLDTHGLVHTDRPALPDDQRRFAVSPARLLEAGLRPAQFTDPVAVARATGATVLIGASACAGAFSEALVREVALHHREPIVLPLSNPGSCVEASPEDILAWTDGRALVAAGGPIARSPARAGRGSSVRATTSSCSRASGSARSSRRRARSPTRCSSSPHMSWPASCRPTGCGRARSTRRPQACGASLGRSRSRSPARRGMPGWDRTAPDLEIEAAVDAAMWWPDYVPLEPGPLIGRLRAVASDGGGGDHRLAQARSTRSKAIATDPPPPRQRVASP